MSDPSVKILLAYHKPAQLLPKNDVYVPVHAGRAIAGQTLKDGALSAADLQWLREHMIGDDTGDNISRLNHVFNEMTVVYWAWKNYAALGNPAYIGFGHYRRAFYFDAADRAYAHDFDTVSDDYLREVHFDNLSKLLEGTDLIGLNAHENLGGKNVLEYYGATRWQMTGDVLAMVDIIRKKHPDFAADAYLNSRAAFFNNTFILKREIFFDYCRWLFDICFEFYESVRHQENRNIHELRSVGFGSENLTAIWQYRMARLGAKIRRVPLAYIKKPDIQLELKPAFVENNIAVFLSTDDKYAAYAGVLIQSIMVSGTAENNYDIVVLHDKLSAENKNKLNALADGEKNISIRFYDVSAMMAGKLFPFRSDITIATYYRLFAPLIFGNYDKIIYLDVDTICCRDIAGLYKLNIANKQLGMIRDYGLMAKTRSGKWETEKYFTETVGVDNIYQNYFQAGVLLMNLNKMRKLDFQGHAIELSSGPRFTYEDQDILNKVAAGDVFPLDSVWNVKNDAGRSKGIMDLMPAKYYEKWLQDRKNPSIIHYASNQKPWHVPGSDLAAIWWKYARQSPFYEEIIYRHMRYAPPKQSAPLTVKKLKRKVWQYKILQTLTLGCNRRVKERKIHYRDALRKAGGKS
jgi:lipopolysaccharide biosynthesis glycosyltransferase